MPRLLLAKLLLLAPPLLAQEAQLLPGDSFEGAVGSDTDRDELGLQALGGSLLTVTVTGKNGLLPQLELLALPARAPVDLTGFVIGAGGPKLTLKNLPLPQDGDYLLAVTAQPGTSGPYKLTTKAKVPSAMKSFSSDGAAEPGSLELTFSALPGTQLTATVKASKGEAATPGVPLLGGPSGPVALDGATTLKPGAKPAAKVAGFVLGELGAYVFTPVALAADGDLPPLATKLKLKFPKPAKIKHVETPTFKNLVTEAVSVSTAGQQAAASSIEPALGVGGGQVAFLSHATNLVAGCGGGLTLAEAQWDVFVRDRVAGTTVSASAPSGSFDGVGGCEAPDLDGPGTLVVFASTSAALVPGDTNGDKDVFVRDLVTLVTTRVSVTTGGAQAQGDSGAPRICGDGRVVTFASTANLLVAGDNNGVQDIFAHDRETITTFRVSTSAFGVEANGACETPAISRDGTRIAFVSSATNLVPGDGNGKKDVFVKVTATGEILRASLTAGGLELAHDASAPDLSGDGRFVAFVSTGPFVPTDTNGQQDVYVKDLLTGAVERASLGNAGENGNGNASFARISDDGQLVLFRSLATNLVAGGDANGIAGDVFLRDRPAATTVRVSLGIFGDQANADCAPGDLSGDGAGAAFYGLATNLVPGNDQNAATDVWLRY
jgi:Tol biopolymer transport system component